MTWAWVRVGRVQSRLRRVIIIDGGGRHAFSVPGILLSSIVRIPVKVVVIESGVLSRATAGSMSLEVVNTGRRHGSDQRSPANSDEHDLVRRESTTTVIFECA